MCQKKSFLLHTCLGQDYILKIEILEHRKRRKGSMKNRKGKGGAQNFKAAHLSIRPTGIKI